MKYTYQGWQKAQEPQDGNAWRPVARRVDDITVHDVICPDRRLTWVTGVGSQTQAQVTADRLNRAIQS